jgi:regulatory protein
MLDQHCGYVWHMQMQAYPQFFLSENHLLMDQYTGAPDKSLEPIIEKGRRFCAFRERCTHETRKKIKSWGCDMQQTEYIIQLLVDEGYINEQRFADAFAHGKFSHNQWGKIKIRIELTLRHIPTEMIQHALSQIDDVAYQKTISKLAAGKIQSLSAKHADNIPEKAAAFLFGKGFEPELSWQAIQQLTDNTPTP